MNIRALLIVPLLMPAAWAATNSSDSDAILKTMAKDNASISNTDKELFHSSVHSEKSSIAYDMLDTFYSDAVDYQLQKRYDEALEIYDKILSISPNYKDVQARRDAITKRVNDAQASAMHQSAQDFIRQGDIAEAKGLTLQALAFWKQALEKDPNNVAAKKKIDELTKAMARRQFEAGYIHYKHNEMEDALDCWENAIGFDPTLKNRGLLLLMAKVQLNLQQEQLTRLANQGYDQYSAGDLQGALKSYGEVLAIQPRHDDARRMTNKIKIQLGQVEFKAALAAAAAKNYPDAITHYQASLDYNWEPVRSQAGIQEMQHQMELARMPPPPKPKPKPKSKPKPPPPPTGPEQGPLATVAIDPKGALEHYRQGLQAIRGKDYQRAIEELQTAQQLDATDERIYMALQRAKQEWQAASTSQ